MRSLPLPVRAVGLFVGTAVWLMVMTLVLSSEGLDAEGAANALKAASVVVVVSVVVELRLARKHPAVTVPAVGVAVLVLCLALDLVWTQLDAYSLVVAVGFAVISVAVVGGEAWWARSGRRGVEATR